VICGSCSGIATGWCRCVREIMNHLQAIASWKKRLFSEQGRAQPEKFPLAAWASQELTAAAKQGARKGPEANMSNLNCAFSRLLRQ
jgi:hypothetical protein